MDSTAILTSSDELQKQLLHSGQIYWLHLKHKLELSILISNHCKHLKQHLLSGKHGNLLFSYKIFH